MMNDNAKILPRISVIIPVRNRDDVILRTLNALENQDYDQSLYQVIVVDDASTDETLDQLIAFSADTRIDFKIIQGPGKGAGYARNLAMEHAQGEILLFLDGDTIPELDLVRKHVELHEQHYHPVCIMGRVDMSLELDNHRQYRLFDTEMPFHSDKMQRVDWQMYRAANTSITWSAIHSIGGFDLELKAAEDTELAWRLNDKGIPIYYYNSLVCMHHHPIDVEGYMEKGAMYGLAVGVWYKKAPEIRRELVSRYGVTAPELTVFRKLKHTFRSVFINRYTFPLIVKSGKIMRKIWLKGSEILLKSAFRFNTRKAFANYVFSNTGNIAAGRS